MRQDKAPGWGLCGPHNVCHTVVISHGLDSTGPSVSRKSSLSCLMACCCSGSSSALPLRGSALPHQGLPYPPGTAWTVGQEKLVACASVHASTWMLARNFGFPMWYDQGTHTQAPTQENPKYQPSSFPESGASYPHVPCAQHRPTHGQEDEKAQQIHPCQWHVSC